jgi:hypothetical protein
MSVCVLHNNEYDTKLINKLPSQKKTKTKQKYQLTKTKWVTFTYNNKDVRGITKLFRDTNIKVAFRTQNTIQNMEYIKTRATNKQIR